MIAGLLLLLLLFSRFLPHPAIDLVLDDWSQRAWSLKYDSLPAILKTALSEPDRPLQAVILTGFFHYAGGSPWTSAVISYLGYCLHLLLFLALINVLTGDARKACLGVLLFCLLPNLTESFLWKALVAVVYVQIAYIATAWCAIRYLKEGSIRHASAAVAAYAIAITSYEFGIALPAAFLILLTNRASMKRAIPMFAAMTVVLGLYLTWRFTKGFGTAHGFLFPPRELEFNIPGILWNAREMVSWWAGDKMFGAIVNGWTGFLSIPPEIRLFLVTGGVVVVASLLLRIRLLPPPPSTPPFSPMRVALFGFAWASLCSLPSLITWSSARANFLIGIGLVIASMPLLARIRLDRSIPVLTVIALLMISANQGTTVAWWEAGHFSRGLYNGLEKHRTAWNDAELILVDTRFLRQRLTPGLAPKPSKKITTVAFYRNSGLIRGFAPNGMLQIMTTNGTHPRAILDVEHNARRVGDKLFWHARYNPTQPFTTAVSRVFAIDALTATIPADWEQPVDVERALRP